MKTKIVVAFVIVFCAVVNCYAQEKNTYQVSIVQGGNVISPAFVNEITLSKTTFAIQVKLNKLDGVYCYAAFNDSIYKLSNTESVPGFESLPSMAMAENSFNTDQELIINPEGWAYWFYDSKLDWHRFDKEILVEGDNVTGTKTIKQFYDVITGKQIPVSEAHGPLYLFFISAKEDNNHNLVKELQRYKIKINWR